MATTLVSDPARELHITDQEVRFYQNEGYLVLPGLIEPAMVQAIRDELFSVIRDQGVDPESFKKASSTADKLRQYGQYYVGGLIEAMIFSPRILAVAEKVMGGPSTTYLPFSAIKAGGGGGEFHFHQDNQYTRHEGPSCNVWIALQDMTPQNGCLCIVPRSNHDGTLATRTSPDGDGHQATAEDPKDYLSLRLNAGDAVVFTRLTVHGSGPNHTDQPRVAYALQFHRNDTHYLDPSDKSWKSLKDHPRWKLQPIARK